jgi:hypothetical protein
MPACASVKEVTTPIAYSGISKCTLALNATTRKTAAPASTRMPLE